MAQLFEILSDIYTHRGQVVNETETGECITKVPRSTFHLYLMIPSILTTLLLAWTHPRKNKWLNILHGRPGVIYPMNILGKSHRFLYGAAWGSIAYLAADLVFSHDIVQLEGPPYVTVFNTVLAMIVIGIDYFPMFSAFAFESYVGYAIGTAYAWMFLIVQIYRDTECDLAGRFRFALLFGDIPNLLCLGYLAISLPIQVLRILRKKSIRLFSSSEKVSVLRRSISVKNSPEAKHVKQLLKPPLPPIEDEPILLKDKIFLKVKTFVSDWIYKREPGFRYSARMISVMVIGLMVIYKITVQITAAIIVVFNASDVLLQQKLDQIGRSPQVNESTEISSGREVINIYLVLIYDMRICFICSICAACIGNIFTILHMMSSYRTNLFDLYKGIHHNIPPRSTLENNSLLVGSIKFAGYQVAYITWGFVIHLIILTIVSLILCIIILLIRYGYYDWILSLLSGIWPTVLMTIFLIVLQKLLSHYIFLQENGEVLAIDNRRMLFSFSFFMFFYNIFIGILSCMLRIIKSIIIGTIFLPRLDISPLPRRFQMLDPGFANYCGFIHTECSHTNPVMIMFLRILMENTEKHRQTEVKMKKTVDIEANGLSIQARTRARTNWRLLYTLHNNPTIRVYRKSYLDYVKQVQERFAKQYKMNKSSIGNLVKHVNKSFVNDETVSVDDVSVLTKAGAGFGLTNVDHWKVLFAVNKFLKKVQNDDSENSPENA